MSDHGSPRRAKGGASSSSPSSKVASSGAEAPRTPLLSLPSEDAKHTEHSPLMTSRSPAASDRPPSIRSAGVMDMRMRLATVNWRRFFELCALSIGASLVALVSGTPNAFNSVSKLVQTDLKASDSEISAMTGVGVAGLFLSLPAGIIADNYGTHAAALGGMLASTIGYVSMSYAESYGMALAAYFAVGIGCGSTFMSALQTAIQMANSWTIAAVSLCMSMSITGTIVLTQRYADETGCSAPDCWRNYMRMYAAITAIACAIGIVSMYLAQSRGFFDHGAPPPPDASTPQRARVSSLAQPLSFTGSLRIFKKPFFWCLFLSNLVALGGGIFIVSSIRQLWTDFTGSETDFYQSIDMYFSLFNAAGNVLSPIISDALHRRGRLRLNRFLAGMLLLMAVVFFLLGLFTSVQSWRESSAAQDMYALLVASVGLGYGTFLVLFPTTLADTYGYRNFGAFMSFMQFGAAIFSVGIPTVASLVYTATGRYSPMHFAFGAAMLCATAALIVPTPPSTSFSIVEPVMYESVEDIEDAGGFQVVQQ